MWNIRISPAGLGQLGKERRDKDEEAQRVPDSRIPLENRSKTAWNKIQEEELKLMKKNAQRVEQGHREAGQPPALEILKIHMEKVWRFLILFQF